MNLFLSVGSLLLELDNLTISIFVQKNYNSRISDGFGWSTFVYILGFILLIAGGIYVSPQVSGSSNEAKMLNSPTEINNEYSRHEA